VPYETPHSNDLDDTDRALIAGLVADGRATYAALAPSVGLSQAAVRARVQRLLDDDIVIVTARIDPQTAGLAVFAFALLLVDEPTSDVTALLEGIDEVVFAACITGRWGLLAELRCRDNRHLYETFDRLRSLSGVAEIESLTVMEYFKQDWTGLVEEVLGQAMPPHQPNPTAASGLDEVDRRLIGELVVDGRASYADLAPVVGLSQAAVRTRVQRLLEEGIVVIQAYASAKALGIGSFAAILITVKRDAARLVTELNAMPEITLVAATSGRYDFVCEIWSRDNADLLASIDRIRRLDEVGVVSSHTFLAVVKEEYRISGLA
jgi:Lrp/AsnC family transcriptional regulator for asnA, asnC and gidA